MPRVPSFLVTRAVDVELLFESIERSPTDFSEEAKL